MEIKTILEKAQNVTILAAEYGESNVAVLNYSNLRLSLKISPECDIIKICRFVEVFVVI